MAKVLLSIPSSYSTELLLDSSEAVKIMEAVAKAKAYRNSYSDHIYVQDDPVVPVMRLVVEEKFMTKAEHEQYLADTKEPSAE